MKKILVALLFVLAATASGEDIIAPFAVVSVYDGDTFTIRFFDESLPDLFREIPVRVRGINAPEITPKNMAACEARDFLTGALSRATRIELRDVKPDKYFRILATVIVDGRDLASIMIARGYAVPYSGGKR